MCHNVEVLLVSVVYKSTGRMRHMNVAAFVNTFTPQQVALLFKAYHEGAYDTLLPRPRRQLTLQEQRALLQKYLEDFILHGEEEDDERPQRLRNIVSHRDSEALIQLLGQDQFFEEPLFRLA